MMAGGSEGGAPVSHGMLEKAQRMVDGEIPNGGNSP